MSKSPRLLCAVAVFLTVFAAHAASPIETSFDSRWTLHTAVSLLHRFDADLDEYEDGLRRDEYYGIERLGGHLYNRYPIGASLFALPFVALLDGAAAIASVPDAETFIRTGRSARLEVLIASVQIAAAAAFLFLIGLELGLTGVAAGVLALLFAFCTSAWSTGSRGLWQHGPSMLALSVALHLLLVGRRRPHLVAWAALPLALALIVRPTNAIPFAAFSLYVLAAHPDRFLGYAGLAGLVIGPWLLGNMEHHQRLIPPYYGPSGQPMARFNEVGTILAGHLVSPNRGLLVFSPIFIFLPVGVMTKLERGSLDGIDVTVIGILIAHWMMVSLAGQWWAGHSYGPRFLSDVLPLMMYLLAPVIPRVIHRSGRRSGILRVSFALCVAWSAFVHFRAATTWDVWAWNGAPVNVDDAPERSWDWSDLQILRGRASATESPAPQSSA